MKQISKTGHAALSKYAGLLICVLFSLCTSSCHPVAAELPDDSDLPEQECSQVLTLCFPEFKVNQELVTREATPVTVEPKRLLVLDYQDGELKQVIQKTTLEEEATESVTQVNNVMEDLSITLSYGNHELYILAANKSFSSFDTDTKVVAWTDTKRPSFTWAKKLSLNIDQHASTTSTVELPLVMAQIQVECLDNHDSRVAKMRITGKFCWELDLNTMKGITPEQAWNYIINTNNITTAGIKYHIFSFVPNSGIIENATLSAQTSNNQVIAEHTFQDVEISVGCLTNYQGQFFISSQTFKPTLESNWINTITHNY